MIRDLENMLRFLMIHHVPELTSDTQVSFRAPDDDWRTEVFNLQQMGLNIYLADLRENRKLRSNEQVRVGEDNGQVIIEVAPARVDCHYLLTAWSPAQAGPAVEPSLDEHQLLYHVMGALMNTQPFNPVNIYGPTNPILANLPDLFKSELPVQILPVEGFFKQAEFWGTMGVHHRWRPAVYLIVTLPLALIFPPAGVMVTSTNDSLRRSDTPDNAPAVFNIGGRVLDASQTPPVPLANAWVQLTRTTVGRMGSTRTDEQGRFLFQRLPAGDYQLDYRAAGKPIPAPRSISLPSPVDEFDLIFS